jgi:hypothetical protein
VTSHEKVQIFRLKKIQHIVRTYYFLCGASHHDCRLLLKILCWEGEGEGRGRRPSLPTAKATTVSVARAVAGGEARCSSPRGGPWPWRCGCSGIKRGHHSGSISTTKKNFVAGPIDGRTPIRTPLHNGIVQTGLLTRAKVHHHRVVVSSYRPRTRLPAACQYRGPPHSATRPAVGGVVTRLAFSPSPPPPPRARARTPPHIGPPPSSYDGGWGMGGVDDGTVDGRASASRRDRRR